GDRAVRASPPDRSGDARSQTQSADRGHTPARGSVAPELSARPGGRHDADGGVLRGQEPRASSSGRPDSFDRRPETGAFALRRGAPVRTDARTDHRSLDASAARAGPSGISPERAGDGRRAHTGHRRSGTDRGSHAAADTDRGAGRPRPPALRGGTDPSSPAYADAA